VKSDVKPASRHLLKDFNQDFYTRPYDVNFEQRPRCPSLFSRNQQCNSPRTLIELAALANISQELERPIIFWGTLIIGHMRETVAELGCELSALCPAVMIQPLRLNRGARLSASVFATVWLVQTQRLPQSHNVSTPQQLDTLKDTAKLRPLPPGTPRECSDAGLRSTKHTRDMAATSAQGWAQLRQQARSLETQVRLLLGTKDYTQALTELLS